MTSALFCHQACLSDRTRGPKKSLGIADMGDVKSYQTAPEAHTAKALESNEKERQLGILDSVYEAKLVRKLDLFIIPMVMLLYLFSFLDR